MRAAVSEFERGVHGAALSVWSAPTTPGKAMPDGTALSACSFARGADLAVHPYMVQSLARQLATLRACFERMLAHEVTHGMKFDWVLRTRTDTAFLMPVPPHCHVDSAAIHHARAFTKGEAVHHMFADHAAIVPRALTRSLFIEVGERLEACAERHEALPPAFSEPESFLHHALEALGVNSRSAPWLAPIVVAIDGRMRKWCERYLKFGAPEIARYFGGEPSNCSRALLDDSAWALGPLSSLRITTTMCSRLPFASRRPTKPHGRGAPGPRPMAAEGATSPRVLPTVPSAGGGASACIRGSACCLRHPRACSGAQSPPSVG